MKTGNLLILQSGIPSVIGNSVLYGILAEALNYEEIEEIYGVHHGFEGIVKEHFIDLASLPQKKAQLLLTTGGYAMGNESETYQGTPEDFDKSIDVLSKYGISYIGAICDQDSLKHVKQLSLAAQKKAYDLQIIVVPHSSYNELPMTDHSLGYGSHLKFLNAYLTSLENILKNERIPIGIYEIEGGNNGWTIAGAALNYTAYNSKIINEEDMPYIICLPEQPFDESCFLSLVKSKLAKHNHISVITHPQLINEEGVSLELGNFNFTGKYLNHLIQKKLNVKTHLNFCDMHMQPLSHFISKTDQNEAIACGRTILQQFEEGQTNKATVLIRKGNEYNSCEINFLPIDDMINGLKFLPSDWLCEKTMTVNHALIRYTQPLIQGEVLIPFEKGIPQLVQL